MVLTDLRMPSVDGMEVLRAAQRLAPETQVIVMTAYGTIESAVGGDPARAPTTSSRSRSRRTSSSCASRRRSRSGGLLGEVSLFAGEFRKRYGLEHVVGRSAAMRDVLDRVLRVGPDRRDRPRDRRVRHRQGARRARHPRREPARGQAVRAR